MGEWRKQFRSGLVAILALAVAGGGTASSVSWMPPEGISADNDSLVRVSLEEIEDVVQGEMAVSQEHSEAVAYSSDGKSLKSTDAAIYKALKAGIEEVARGEETSTEFALQTKWSQSKLAQVDVNTIVSYLLNDCPFDLYWHDKTKTLEGSKEVDGVYCKYYDDGKIVFSFKVSAAYRTTPDDLYTVNTAYMDTVKAARQKAQSIVDTNQGCSDYDKLLNYRNAICDLVYYDSAALADPLYGNSYQVISVFDDDWNSNVVCEGYAKAFKYLCDLSSFDHEVDCYTVTGVTDAGAGAGEHMWNVVTVGGADGESYLVDVTNCDTGTIGEGTQLFMTDELSGSVDAGYTFSNGWSSITYQYNGESRDVYGSQILSLANDDNEEEARLHVKEEGNDGIQQMNEEDLDGSDITEVKEKDDSEEQENIEPQSESDSEPETTLEQTDGFTFGNEKTIDAVYGMDSFTKTILGYDGSRKVTYTSSDPTVATVSKRGKVSILGVGTTVITAEGAGGEKDSYTLNVEPKKLEWDTSGLYAIDRQDKIKDNKATLYGEIKLEGILPNDKDRDSQFSFDSGEYLDGTYEDVVAGRQRVILNWQDGKEVRLTRNGKAANYEMPEALPEFYGTITALKRLEMPKIETGEEGDGIEYKLEMEDGVSEVPDTLKGNRELNTPLKIVNRLKEDLKEQGVPEGNFVVYDVTLSWLDKAQSSDDEGSWSKITDESFPSDGLTLTLPYPGGMPRGADIVVSHMFTEDMYTSDPGEIEHPVDIVETVDGIQFTVYGLSPIAIGWSTGDGVSGDTGNGNEDTTNAIQSPNKLPDNTGTQNNQNNQNNQNKTNQSPVTGDSLQFIIYAVLIALCAATIKGIQAIRHTKKKR